MIAIVNDRYDLAATLVELGADVNDGSLYHAVEMRDATTDWYARDGSKLRANHANQRTALDLIALLLDKGADPNKPLVGQLHSATMCCDTVANGSPFFRAAIAADVEALKLLMAKGADLEWTPSKAEGLKGANTNVGLTPLMVAMKGGRGVPFSAGPGFVRKGPPPFREPSNREPADAVKLLLEAGANPNAVAPTKATVLHLAVETRNLETLRALTAAGASLTAKNADGLTPLQVAEKLKPDDPENRNPFGPQDFMPVASPEEIVALLREAAAGPAVAHEVRRAAMRKSIYLGAGGVAAVAAAVALVVVTQRSPDAVLHERWAMIDRYCVDCHNDAELTGGVSLQRLKPENVVADARIWEAALRKLRLGMMPPREEPQPEPEARESFVAALEATLDAAAAARPHAGAESVHRLNRAEYANAVRDLFGVEIDVAELLPSDGGDFGFDNIASVLTHVAAAARALFDGGVAHCGCGNRRRPSGTDGCDLQDRCRSHAESAHGRAAARHARRHDRPSQLPGGRAVRAVGPVAQYSGRGVCGRRRTRRAARVPDHDRRRAGVLGADRRTRGPCGELSRFPRVARCHRRAHDIAAPTDHRRGRTRWASPGSSVRPSSRAFGSRRCAPRRKPTIPRVCRDSSPRASKGRTTPPA